MVFDYALVGLGIISVWLIIVTLLLWRSISHYNKMTRGINEKSLKAVLENLIDSTSQSKKDIEALYKHCDKIDKDSLLHIQKIGLLRFNPFKDTGGDQSFILTLTDATDTGVIISGLYSRSGTRWYAKKVVQGKGTEHELSEEEKKALSEAGKQK